MSKRKSTKAENVTIEIGTILSNRTKQGVVELLINETRVQMDVAKAREVSGMLHEAIEAAISDTMFFQFLTQRIGMTEEKAAAALMDFRELRQGTRDTLYPN